MASVDESTVSPLDHRQMPVLQPLSPRIPTSIDRHFEQYLIDHHHYPKLPSISKQPNRQTIENSFLNDKNFFSYRAQQIPSEHNNGSISRLLNSEQYRRSHARLIEYRQRSKIPGVALATTNNSNENSSTQINGRNELTLPLKEVLMETTRTKQHQQQDDIDFVDDDSVFSHETDRRLRAKHWIKDHQFFFTEYQ
jgi:hypothetical protein